MMSDNKQKSEGIEIPQEMVNFLENTINWILPGCQLFYRDTDADIDVRKAYPVGAVIRAGFFIDVTAKVQKPITHIRYIIASAHAANIGEVTGDEDMLRWRLYVIHFNSYFKVMDVYEKQGVTQIFLLHIPYQAVPFFQNENSFNLIQGASGMNMIEVARKSLDSKLQMDVFADTTEQALMERMVEPVGIDVDGNLLPLDFMEVPDSVKALSDGIRKLGYDTDEINYPTNYKQ